MKTQFIKISLWIQIASFLKFNTVIKTLNSFKNIDFFVQVGSHDGEMFDPLKDFILKNKWYGILIEPQKEMIDKIKFNYRNINNLIFINAAVYHKREKINLYKVDKIKDYSHTGWASINPNRFDNTIYSKNFVKETVQGIPLMDIIEENKFKKIDLVQIDTEGYDADILRMFNFDTHRPVIIQYEHVHLSNSQLLSTKKLLEAKKYLLIKGKNDIMAIKTERLNLVFFLVYFIIRLKDSFISRVLRRFRF